MYNKNFDLSELAYVPAPKTAVPTPPPGEVNIRPQRPRKGHFVKVPLEWMERLNSARSAATWAVALHLLHQSFKDRRHDIRLANGALALKGVTPKQKWRALEELGKLGLVSIENRPRKSPIVTLLSPTEGGWCRNQSRDMDG
jgi:hypothetical protein